MYQILAKLWIRRSMYLFCHCLTMQRPIRQTIKMSADVGFTVLFIPNYQIIDKTFTEVVQQLQLQLRTGGTFRSPTICIHQVGF